MTRRMLGGLTILCAFLAGCGSKNGSATTTTEGDGSNRSGQWLARVAAIPESFQGNWAENDAACGDHTKSFVITPKSFEVQGEQAAVTSVKQLDMLNLDVTLVPAKSDAGSISNEKVGLSATGDRLTINESGNVIRLVRCNVSPAEDAAPEAGAVSSGNRTDYGDCSITVDAITYLNRKKTCSIEKSDDTTTVNTGDSNIPAYFAYITDNGNSSYTINWNSKEKWNHAEEDLGSDFGREGNCWINRRARVCASK